MSMLVNPFAFGTGGGFAPSIFDGMTDLELWLPSDRITPQSDDTALVQWDDFSGNANHGVQATSGFRAKYRTNIHGSLPALQFIADNSNWYEFPDFLTGFTEGEVYLVGQLVADPPASGGRSGLWYMGSAVGGSVNTHFPFTDGVIYDQFGTDTRKTTVNPTPSLTSKFIYNVVSKSGEWTSRLNGTQIFTTATNTVGWSTVPRIGQGSSSFSYDGYIFEIAVLSVERTSLERTAIETDLSDKWL